MLPLTIMAVSAQNKTEDAGAGKRTYVGGTYLGTFQPEEADPTLMPEFQLIRNKVNKSQNEEELRLYKDSLMKLKLAASGISNQTSNKTTGTIDPERTFGFNALVNQGTPSDNTIAVGNSGKMIAAVNSSLRVYNSNGTPAGTIKYFPTFWNSVTNKTDMCDPLVFYDANVDRFIVFTQICDRSTTDNRILMAFSTTNDPSGSYHFYSFRSNLREILGSSYPYNVWFDYPKMGVSQSDVFVTGNLFANSGQSSFPVESVIFQIDKAACFAGSNNPTAIVFNSITGTPFTIVPASDGFGGHYGNKMHFAVTSNGNTVNTIRMYTVDGKVDNQPSISTALVNTPTYSQPADGVQLGSNVALNSGDKRGMSAVYIDGVVHFAFHSNGPNNYIAINYNRLQRSGTSWSVQNKLISFPGVDCAYPAVAAFGHTPTDQSAVIVFNYSSLSTYPGYRAVAIDHTMNVSNFEELNTGVGAVTFLTDNQGRTRWGDYCGISRKYNESRPTVWGFGTYGNSSSRWSNHISEIKSSSWVVGTEDIESKKLDKANVYPNPIVDLWTVRVDIAKAGQLTVKVYDMLGREVRDVFTANVSAGESEFSFNKNGLANGSYFVKVFLDQTTLANEKIIVSK